MRGVQDLSVGIFHFGVWDAGLHAALSVRLQRFLQIVQLWVTHDSHILKMATFLYSVMVLSLQEFVSQAASGLLVD